MTGDAKINDGKVKLEVPPLSENGNAVALTVTVESPMTASDHVKSIHIFAEKNFQPNVMSINPDLRTTTVQTRIRLANPRHTAIAERVTGRSGGIAPTC